MAERNEKGQTSSSSGSRGIADSRGGNFDDAERAHFTAMGGGWHDPAGAHAALHRLNPARLRWLKGLLRAHFYKVLDEDEGLAGLRVLDIGCGGGLLSAPLARLGASVTGIDLVEESVDEASAYAKAQGLEIEYRVALAEDLLKEGRQFDAVLLMEVLEHVPSPEGLIATATGLVREGGLVCVATLNRSWESWLVAIVAAEHLLRQIPVGTHHYGKLIRPDEMRHWLRGAGLGLITEAGVVFDIWSGVFRISSNMRVNYMMAAEK